MGSKETKGEIPCLVSALKSAQATDKCSQMLVLEYRPATIGQLKVYDLTYDSADLRNVPQ